MSFSVFFKRTGQNKKRARLGLRPLLVLGLCSLAALSCTSPVYAPFSMRLTQSYFLGAGPHEFEFFLSAENSGVPVLLGSDQMLVDYESSLHAYVFDSTLEAFQHVHPIYQSDGSWSVPLTFQHDGDYQLWAEGIVRGPSQSETLRIGTAFEVEGVGPAPALPTALEDTSVAVDRGSGVRLEWERTPRAGEPTLVTVRFFREDGALPSLGTYLGSTLHATGARLGGGEILHAHGMAVREGEEVVIYLEVVPLEQGDYRLWLQFVESNELRTVALNKRVEER